MSQPYVGAASVRRLFLTLASLLVVVPSAAWPDSPAPYKLPLFRTVDEAAKAPEAVAGGTIRLLADAEFPPFSFASQTGAPTGLAVDLALAACAEVKLGCEVVLRPFAELLPALATGDGDVVISGPRIDEKSLQSADATRPYFRTLARFAVQSGSPLKAGDTANLAGKRIGVVRGSSHEAWLNEYYGGSQVQAFATEAEAGEALRTGNVDVFFGDNLHVIYWITGAISRDCCRLLGGAYSDLDYFSRNLAFFVRSDRGNVRGALDYGLDQIQAKGKADEIFNRYIPLNPW